MGRMDGKIAVVTGAGSGIGRGIAVMFAKEGAKVVCASRGEKSGLETLEMIKAVGGEASGESYGINSITVNGGTAELIAGDAPTARVAYSTPGLGSNLSSPGLMKQFKGLDAKEDIKVKKDGGTVEAITSATITSRAVCEAINAAR